MKRYLLLSFVGLIILSLIIFLYNHSESQLVAKHQKTMSLFASARQVDVSLEKDLLKSKNYLSTSYDLIANGEKEMESICSLFKEGEINLQAMFPSEVDGYCELLENKIADIEIFKSKSAILKNSLFVIQKMALEKSINPKLQEVIKLVLAYSIIPTKDLKTALENSLQNIQAKKFQHSMEFETGVMHVVRILETKESLDSLIKSIMSSNSDQKLQEIYSRYFKNYTQEENSAGLYRKLLFSVCVLFLFFTVFNVIQLWKAARNLTEANTNLENKVKSRTQELEKSKEQIIEQQQALMTSAKMSSLGEMAGGVAHEINTPLAIITMRLEQLEECANDNTLDIPTFLKSVQILKRTTDRITKIVSGLRFFARDGKSTPLEMTSVKTMIQDTLGFCNERFANHGIQVDIQDSTDGKIAIPCRPVEFSQVLLNLLNNAFDAISNLPKKWIKIEIVDREEYLEISVTDSGPGIPKDIQDKIMQPFFTTKEVGKGTGLGLSISRGIIESHHGKFILDKNNSHTCFTLLLPKKAPESIAQDVA